MLSASTLVALPISTLTPIGESKSLGGTSPISTRNEPRFRSKWTLRRSVFDGVWRRIAHWLNRDIAFAQAS